MIELKTPKKGRRHKIIKRRNTPEEIQRRKTQPQQCYICREIKPASQFARITSFWCRDCQRAKGREYGRNKDRGAKRSDSRKYYLLAKYGLTTQEYDDMSTLQSGLCAICLKKPENKLNVDHDHATGKVRQLLCLNCNTVLAHARDNPEILKSGVKYLKRHKVLS